MKSSSKSSGVRGVSWREKETLDLIAIWGEGRVQNALASRHKNIDVFEDISRQMHALGNRRSAEECRTKSKSLRQEYRRVVNHNAKSGSVPISCPYFELLDRILANEHSVLPPDLKKSSKVRFCKPRGSDKENIHTTVTEDHFNSDRMTINPDDLRTSTPLPMFARPSCCRDSCAETISDSQDPRTDDISPRVSTGRGNSGLSVASEDYTEEQIDDCEQEEMSSHNTDEVADRDRSSGGEQARKEEKRVNEAERVRRVALLNDVAVKMMEQGTSEHKETMQCFADWKDLEERKYQAMLQEGQLDRRLLQETMQRHTDVLTMAVDALRHLGEVLSVPATGVEGPGELMARTTTSPACTPTGGPCASAAACCTSRGTLCLGRAASAVKELLTHLEAFSSFPCCHAHGEDCYGCPFRKCTSYKL